MRGQNQKTVIFIGGYRRKGTDIWEYQRFQVEENPWKVILGAMEAAKSVGADKIYFYMYQADPFKYQRFLKVLKHCQRIVKKSFEIHVTPSCGQGVYGNERYYRGRHRYFTDKIHIISPTEAVSFYDVVYDGICSDGK